MKTFTFFLLAASLLTALSAAPPSRKALPNERITKKNLLRSDRLLLYTPTKPCWLDKYKYFCCPVRKIVRRKVSEGKWTDYCYNAREELIGIRKSSSNSSVKRSDFTAIGGCSQCRSSEIKRRTWKHDTRPRLAPAKSKKRR